LLLNLATLTLHQFEELGWPCGFPWMYNEVVNPKGGPADRYPLNQNNNLFINVWAAYPFCLLPVFFPNALSLDLVMVLFGVGQLVVHAVVNNSKLRSVYNPGLATVEGMDAASAARVASDNHKWLACIIRKCMATRSLRKLIHLVNA
jgi:hypothetical protein